MNLGLSKQERAGVLFYTPTQIMEAGGVNAAFSTRVGGVSGGCFASMNLGFKRGDSTGNVLENYRRFCGAAGFDVASLVFNTQVHSDRLVKITGKVQRMGLTMAVPQEADGFLTDVPGVTLTSFYADCLPILFYDPVRKAAGIVHAGWRGTVSDIAGKAVRELGEEFGCEPENILAVIGPSLCADHFEVDTEVSEQFRAAFGDEYPQISMVKNKTHIDLWKANTLRLLKAGLSDRNITVASVCTFCESDLFFSHRRMGDARGNHTAFLELLEAK